MTDTLTDLSTGDLVEQRRKFNSYFNKDPFLSASWALERGADKAIRLNARWQPSSFDLFQRNRVSPAGEPDHDDNLIQRYRDPVIELGGDVTRPLAGGAIKFVGLATRRKRHDVDTYIQREGRIADNAPVNGGFEQSIRARRNETHWSRELDKVQLARFLVRGGRRGIVQHARRPGRSVRDGRGRPEASASTFRSPMRRSRRSVARSM